MFTGTWDSNQYGQLTYEEERIRAHVASYTAYNGPIPEGMYVCHTCDNPWCIEPTHLFLGTHIDNIKDMWAKGRGVHQDTTGERNGQAKLTAKDVLEIRQLLCEGYTQTELAAIYGIDNSSVWKIEHRRSWRHI